MHKRQAIPLQDKRLLCEYNYINGQWQAASDCESLPVLNPANEQLLGFVPAATQADCEQAIASAKAAWPVWAGLLPTERSHLLRRWHDLIMARQDDLALLITHEQGKPLADAQGEIAYAASFVEWFAEEAKRVNGTAIQSHLPQRDMVARREPIGVTAAVTPWNFPAAMITRKAAAALAAACPMIVRPSPETPLTALALAELADQAGLPAGVFSVITGGNHLVKTLSTHPDIRAFSFTGSTEVGRLLLGYAADTVKRMSLELGGHAPFVLFPDTELAKGVQGALAAKFQTNGQDCQAANRIYVHEQCYEDFLQAFQTAIRAFKVGNGLQDEVDIGPLINEAAVAKCQAQVDDALAKGARLLCGGQPDSAKGARFFQATLLADVTPAMRIYHEETFGPVAAVTPFQDEASLLPELNHAEYGLMAYLYTRDADRIARLTRALEYGLVAVNCVKVTGYPVPFGGFKQSGLGREGGHWGLDEFTEIKYVCAYYEAA